MAQRTPANRVAEAAAAAATKGHRPKAQVAKLAPAGGSAVRTQGKSSGHGKAKKQGDDGTPGIFELAAGAAGDDDNAPLPAIRHVPASSDDEYAAGSRHDWRVHNPKLKQCERTVEYKMAGEYT